MRITAHRIAARNTAIPLVFARLVGRNTCDINAVAIAKATFGPGVGFTGLYFVFRSFDSNSERRPVLLGSALLLFIFTCCLLLYIVSR